MANGNEVVNNPPSERGAEDIMFSSPIPGEGMTSDPSTPKPWETPPEFVEVEKAQEFLFERIMENGEEFVGLMADGIPIENIATTIVVGGFQEGKWNPDLVLLLAEPTMYILLFLAEQAGVDYVLSFNQEEESMEPEGKAKMYGHLSESMKKVSEKVKEQTASAPVAEMLPSLLGKGEI